jgi:hypothetical protein
MPPSRESTDCISATLPARLPRVRLLLLLLPLLPGAGMHTPWPLQVCVSVLPGQDATPQERPWKPGKQKQVPLPQKPLREQSCGWMIDWCGGRAGTRTRACAHAQRQSERASEWVSG